ncbi:alpha/beta hydrolase [Hyphomonas sp.]|uniref:alpha/beta fold hydrolase n=1 Tax=Hyphomonas sp. TaxID=87 RepID=UPI0025C2DF69|nr:alpha/beta hydrolase [Hyphomonas sp.]MBI1400196.1 alpha/beta fold hydrolase [Hyphomonas sp.]
MARAKTNGIELEYDTMGSPNDPAVLLIMGFALQMTRWPEALKRGIADAGFRVIWFDNRDVGLSTEIAGFTPPSAMEIIQAAMAGKDTAKLVPYTLDDMATDTAGLLDAIGIEQADIIGMSMGGMIGQLMALDHPRKVRKLVAMMTTSGNPALPPPTPEAMAALSALPPVRTAEAIGEIAVVAQHGIGSHPDLRNSAEIIRARAIEDFHRSDRPFGILRQNGAVVAQKRWHERLGQVTAPTLVLHGADDPLVRPAAGEDIARRIPGAVFKRYPKWGHDLADRMSDTLVSDIVPFLRA